ncbi:antibiotic resistance protein MarC [Calothrix sp. HK-06]|nr:antibiotic resistance protein MarC [Calothrix sp. HK-06]
MDRTLILNFGIAILAIVNPIGNLPVFVSYTTGERRGVQRWLALFVALTILVFLVLFLIAGTAILKFFGITLAAFKIAGGILLLLTGLTMVKGEQTKKTQAMAAEGHTSDLQEAELVFRKILIPLGIPMFVGPGSISTVIIYGNQAKNDQTLLGLVGVIFLLALLVFLVLLSSNRIQKVLGGVGLDVATRLLGLILSAIGVQLILSGLGDATINLIKPSIIYKQN